MYPHCIFIVNRSYIYIYIYICVCVCSFRKPFWHRNRVQNLEQVNIFSVGVQKQKTRRYQFTYFLLLPIYGFPWYKCDWYTHDIRILYRTVYRCILIVFTFTFTIPYRGHSFGAAKVAHQCTSSENSRLCTSRRSSIVQRPAPANDKRMAHVARKADQPLAGPYIYVYICIYYNIYVYIYIYFIPSHMKYKVLPCSHGPPCPRFWGHGGSPPLPEARLKEMLLPTLTYFPLFPST